MSKKEKTKRSILIIIIMLVACFSIINARSRREKQKEEKKQEYKEVIDHTGSFTVDMIREVNANTKENYLISPYNIEIALNMLREGASGNTKKEIDKVVEERVINDVSIPDKVSVANAVFIKNAYQNNVKESFMNIMKEKYQSEVLYDEFKNPDVINNWANEKTKGMIPKVLDEIDESFMIGLASALTIDVKWQSAFECTNTTSEEFTKLDNNKINVEMMHQTYQHNAQYIKTEDAEGIIIPYRMENDSSRELEFVALLPNTNVYEYVNSLTKEKLDNIFTSTKDASNSYRISLSLPRFTYNYSIDELDKPLNNLGIKDAFIPKKADFSNMIDIDAYIGQAVHKTHIELNETGTKAAAVTFFGVEAAGFMEPEKYELIEVKFDKPFVYMIREKTSGEMLFFGSVYEPNIWNGSTCSN